MGGNAAPSLVSVVAVCLLVAGCGSSVPTTSGSDIEGGAATQMPTLPAPTAQPSFTGPTTQEGQQQFVTDVFNDIQSTWSKEFEAARLAYRPARLVIFTSSVATSCGAQSSEVGPFYCPGDDS